MPLYIQHSAKGSEWKKHKYAQKINGVYFYPEDYIGGRHIGSAAFKLAKAGLNSMKKGTKKTAEGKKGEEVKSDGKTSKKIEKLAQDVIRGKYGNGKDRMDKLGKKYEKVQHRVNQLLLGEAGAQKVLDRKKKASSSSGSKLSSKKTTSKRTTKKK